MLYSGIIMTTGAILATENSQLMMCYVNDLALKLDHGPDFLNTINQAVKTLNPWLTVEYYDPEMQDVIEEIPETVYALRIDASTPWSQKKH